MLRVARPRKFISQLYQGFLERTPSAQERDDWAGFLMQTGNLKSTVEFFIKSPEYAQKNKNHE